MQSLVYFCDEYRVCMFSDNNFKEPGWKSGWGKLRKIAFRTGTGRMGQNCWKSKLGRNTMEAHFTTENNVLHNC